MAWYSAGTVSVTNGSATVTGSGTAWVANAQASEGIWLPDGRLYEIVSINSDTSLTISPNYLGTTQSGQVYRIVPVKGYPLLAAQQMAALISTVQGYVDGALSGRFGDGTVGAPGVSFASNTAMGIYRVAANQLGIATNGVRRVLLTTSAMQVDVPITGSAVQDAPDDSTSGRLLKMGAFGLGATILQASIHTASDMDDGLLPAGTYGVTNNTAGTRPSGASAYGVLEVRPLLVVGETGTAQIHQTYRDASAEPKVWERAYRGSAFSAWQRVYTSGNLLGPVSQSGGVPTEAAIERGSNANGEYVKFADGTMSCSRIIAVDVTNTSPQTFNLAASFAASSAPSVSYSYDGTLYPNAALAASNIASITALSTNDKISIRLASAGSATPAEPFKDRLRITVHGRWL